MAARGTVVIISAAPSNAIANIAHELARRGHFTFFGTDEPMKWMATMTEASNVQAIKVDTSSPGSLMEASATVASGLSKNGLSGLDTLVNDMGVGSPLALLDVMVDESPGEYETKVSDALSLYAAFANLLQIGGGKVLNMSSSGAMISAPGMNRVSSFTSERALVGISEQMRAERLTDIAIETAMLESVPSAKSTTPSVIVPATSRYLHARSAFSWWVWGSSSKLPLETLYDLVLAERCGQASRWFEPVKFSPRSEVQGSIMV